MGSIKKPKWLKWLPQDKFDHLIVGLMPGMLGFVAGHIYFEEADSVGILALMSAILFGVVVGVAKEMVDGMDPPNFFDVVDVVATIVGAAIGALGVWGIYSLL